jgi:hypothetical protein
MVRHQRELQAGGWRVNSVYVRKRDGPARVEHAYRTLVEDRVPLERVPSDGKEQGDAGGDLRAGVHRAPGTGADD